MQLFSILDIKALIQNSVCIKIKSLSVYLLSVSLLSAYGMRHIKRTGGRYSCIACVIG